MARSPENEKKKCDRCGKDFLEDFHRTIDRIIECPISNSRQTTQLLNQAPPPLPPETSRIMFTKKGIGFVTAYICPKCHERTLEFALEQRRVQIDGHIVHPLIFLGKCPQCKAEYLMGWGHGRPAEEALTRDFQLIQRLKRNILGERILSIADE